MTPEGLVVAAIKKEVALLGGEVRKCQWVGHNGAPDLFIMLWGHHMWLEVKTEKGRLSEGQKREIGRMRDAGCDAFVVYGLKQAIDAIHNWAEAL